MCFPALGDDRWVAISLFSDEDRAKLAAIAGPDIAAWTAAREDHAIAAELQAAGIACGVVQDAEDMIEHDPQLAARGALVELPHPLLGPFGHIATPLRFSRDRVRALPRAGHGRTWQPKSPRPSAGFPKRALPSSKQQGVFK